MTPERKEYLAKHTGREAIIRHLIRVCELEIKDCKITCSNYDLKTLGYKPFGYRIHITRIKETKIMLCSLRRELARLKGMDRVVVPRDAYTRKYLEAGTCACGFELDKKHHNYCPKCGRRILWKKVK